MEKMTAPREFAVTPRPTKLEWIKQYFTGLCNASPKSDGRYWVQVDVHRGSISHVAIFPDHKPIAQF